LLREHDRLGTAALDPLRVCSANKQTTSVRSALVVRTTKLRNP
jgi:hypothetical protein